MKSQDTQICFVEMENKVSINSYNISSGNISSASLKNKSGFKKFLWMDLMEIVMRNC